MPRSSESVSLVFSRRHHCRGSTLDDNIATQEPKVKSFSFASQWQL